jgi:hypothetical protein
MDPIPTLLHNALKDEGLINVSTKPENPIVLYYYIT